MTTDLVTINTDSYDAATLALLGFGRPGGGDMEDSLPVLKINTDHVVEVEREDGTKEDVNVTAGCFKVRHDGETVYSMKNPVTLRIFMQRFDFKKYDEAANDGKGGYVGHSILISQGEEPIDDQGGIALGKVRGKAAKGELSEAQKLIQKAVQSYRVLYGVVSFKGQTAEGKKVEITNLPIQMRLRGTNFMPVGDVLKEFEQRKALPMSINIGLKTKREKKGSTVFYIIEYDYDISKRITVGKDDIALVNQFVDHIKTYNAAIRDKHKAALEKRSVATVGNSDGLDADFGEDPDDTGTEID